MPLADYYEVNGKKMPVVQDDDRIFDKSDISALGTDIGEGLIFIRVEDMPHQPLPDSSLDIKSPRATKATRWFITNIIENWGVYEIRIRRQQQ